MVSIEEPLPPNPYLGSEMRVELHDGRVVVGTMIAHQGSGDILLQHVIEQRRHKADECVAVRYLNLLAIPFKHIKTLHKRREGEPPLFPDVPELAQEMPAAPVV